MFVPEQKICFRPANVTLRTELPSYHPSTVFTAARSTRNIAQSSAVGALCVRLHGGVWGGLCPPLSSPGRLYLATFANLVAERTAVYLRQPFNITSASYHQALEHCQAQKPLNTIITFPTRLQTTSKMSSF